MHLNQILAMGGYALYVWPAYFITLLVFGINVGISIREKRQTRTLLTRYLISQSVDQHER